MTLERTVLDVSKLPSVSFGHRSLLWWGTVGFVVIEGFTLAIMVAAYFYLRLAEIDWPPAPLPPPDLLFPTINTILLLVILVPMSRVDIAARRFDASGVMRGLIITVGLTLLALVLRALELMALNVRWDTNAYGSVAWGVVVLHATLIIVDFWETLVLWLIFATGHSQKKHFSDASDASFYQYFLSLSWVPLYLIVYWGPRVL